MQLTAIGGVHCTYLMSHNAEHTQKFTSKRPQAGHLKLPNCFELHLWVLQFPTVKSAGSCPVLVVLVQGSEVAVHRTRGIRDVIWKPLGRSVLSTVFKQCWWMWCSHTINSGAGIKYWRAVLIKGAVVDPHTKRAEGPAEIMTSLAVITDLINTVHERAKEKVAQTTQLMNAWLCNINDKR